MHETGFADRWSSTEADTWVSVEAHKRNNVMAENRKSTVIAIRCKAQTHKATNAPEPAWRLCGKPQVTTSPDNYY